MQIAEAVKIRVHGRAQTNSASVPDRSKSEMHVEIFLRNG
jgi:hypothetical protein